MSATAAAGRAFHRAACAVQRAVGPECPCAWNAASVNVASKSASSAASRAAVACRACSWNGSNAAHSPTRSFSGSPSRAIHHAFSSQRSPRALSAASCARQPSRGSSSAVWTWSSRSGTGVARPNISTSTVSCPPSTDLTTPSMPLNAPSTMNTLDPTMTGMV